MDLYAWQHFLGKLYADKWFLQWYQTDPHAAGRSWGLDETTTNMVKQLDLQQVDKVNRIMQSQREAELRHAFPTSYEHHSNGMLLLMEDFFKLQTLHSLDACGRKHLCQQFLNFCEQRLALPSELNFETPDWWIELLQFEWSYQQACHQAITQLHRSLMQQKTKSILDVSRPYFHEYLIHVTFQWPILDIIEDLKQGQPSVSYTKEACSLIWIFLEKTPQPLKLFHQALAVIPLCTYEHTVKDIRERLAGEHAMSRTDVDATLSFLLDHHVVSLL